MIETINTLIKTGIAFFALIIIFSINACIRGSIYDEAYKIESAIEPPILKVGLSKYLNVASAKVSVDGSFNITRLDGWIIMRNSGISKALCTALGDTIRLDDLTISEKAVRLEPLNDGTIYIDGINYHGNLLIHNNSSGKISFINEVNVEDYLSGVIGKEIGNSSPEAALKAQAIAARTFAIYEQRTSAYKNENRIFDLYDDQRSQVYGGMDGETSTTIKTVKETRGTVLAYNNKLVKTFYSSTCGGYTEPAWEIFSDVERGVPPLAGGKCGYCTSSKYYKWEAIIPKDEISRALFPNKVGKPWLSLAILNRLPGRHVGQITATVSGEPQPIILDAYGEFRRRINTVSTSSTKKNIRSTLFEIVDLGDSYKFVGNGWGHAVGLCQVGAINMASLGWDYRTILQYYYPQADIVKIY